MFCKSLYTRTSREQVVNWVVLKTNRNLILIKLEVMFNR